MMVVAKNRNRVLSMKSMAWMTSLCTETAEGEHKRLYQRLSALAGDPKGSVEDTMSGWLKEGRLVTESDLTGIIRGLRKFKNFKVALELTDWMEKKGLQITFSTHAMRLDLIAKIRGVDTAERYFHSLPKCAKNEKTYGSLLNIYCKEKMADMAIPLFQTLKRLNLCKSLTYNNMMALHLKLDKYAKVIMYFQEMKEANISPDTVSFCILINSYTLLNDTESVERVVEDMKKENVALSFTLYCNLAAHYNSVRMYQKSESALKKAEEIMNHRDRISYHSMLSLYAGAGNLEGVIRVWKLLKAKFIATNTSYYNMLHALKRLGEIDALTQCFKDWESIGDSSDVRLLNVMNDAYLKKGMVVEAEVMREKGILKGFGLDPKTLDLFTGYYLESSEMGLAFKCLEVINSSAEQCEWRPSEDKVNAFLQYFEELNDVDGAEKFRRILKKLNLP